MPSSSAFSLNVALCPHKPFDILGTRRTRRQPRRSHSSRAVTYTDDDDDGDDELMLNVLRCQLTY